MALTIGRIKCCLCKNKDGLIRSVCYHGIYGEIGKRIYYHQECLEMIEAKPEKFGHRLIDKVIDINDKVDECKRINNKIIDGFIKKVEKLHNASFERMMPKK